jgi:hypothetical protein
LAAAYRGPLSLLLVGMRLIRLFSLAQLTAPVTG